MADDTINRTRGTSTVNYNSALYNTQGTDERLQLAMADTETETPDRHRAGRYVAGQENQTLSIEERSRQRAQATPVLRQGDHSDAVRDLQTLLRDRFGYSLTVDGDFGPGTRDAIGAFQLDYGLTIDSVVGPQTWRILRTARPIRTLLGSLSQNRAYVRTHTPTLSAVELVHWTALNESGPDAYSAVNPNDRGTGGVSAGVSFGRFQFNQAKGALGKLFRLMYEADRATLIRLTYGDNTANRNPEQLLEQLMEDLESTSEHRRLNGRRSRTMINSGRWENRLRRLGRHPAFQRAQEELAADEYLAPAQRMARTFELKSERATVLLFDMSIHHGPSGARGMVNEVFAENHAAVARLRDATTPTSRANAEHDLLVLIARESEQRHRGQAYAGSLVRRRQNILRAAELSDLPMGE